MKNKRGFTLIELIVVVAIIAVLLALLVPAVMKFIQSSQDTANAANAKKIFEYVQMQIVMDDAMDTKSHFRKSIASGKMSVESFNGVDCYYFGYNGLVDNSVTNPGPNNIDVDNVKREIATLFAGNLKFGYRVYIKKDEKDPTHSSEVMAVAIFAKQPMMGHFGPMDTADAIYPVGMGKTVAK